VTFSACAHGGHAAWGDPQDSPNHVSIAVIRTPVANQWRRARERLRPRWPTDVRRREVRRPLGRDPFDGLFGVRIRAWIPRSDRIGRQRPWAPPTSPVTGSWTAAIPPGDFGLHDPCSPNHL